MTSLFDTHAHYNLDPFYSDWEAVLAESLDHGVVGGVVVGTSLLSSAKAVELAEKSHVLHAAVGVHPIDEIVEDQTSIPKHLTSLIQPNLLEQKRIVAIGEIGLDYSRVSVSSDVREKELSRQNELLKLQLELANQVNLPVILHCRDAHQDIFSQLESCPNTKPFIFHCMSGSMNELYRALEFNSYISFAANITYPKSEELRRMVVETPVERLLIETDSPYLPPQSHRGGICQPWYIRETFELVASLKQMGQDELGAVLSSNTERCFEIKVNV